MRLNSYLLGAWVFEVGLTIGTMVSFCVWTILFGLGCKLRVFALLFGVLEVVFDDKCSIEVIRFLNLLPCELDKVGILSELVCFLGFTNKE